MKTVRLFFLLWLVVVPAVGQDLQSELRRYRVEMLFFAHTGASAGSEEQWPLESRLTKPPAAVDVFGDNVNPQFIAVPQSDLDLNNTRAALQRSGRYEVILHVGWEQPGLDATSAPPVYIHGGIDYSAQFPDRTQGTWTADAQGIPSLVTGPQTLKQLDGIVRLVRARYLHVYTDLIFRRPMEETPTPTSIEAAAYPTTVLRDIPIQGHRRMRSRELHYIDHPLLGILVQVTPIESEAQVEELLDEEPPVEEPPQTNQEAAGGGI